VTSQLGFVSLTEIKEANQIHCLFKVYIFHVSLCSLLSSYTSFLFYISQPTLTCLNQVHVTSSDLHATVNCLVQTYCIQMTLKMELHR
jgi:hypothetical protein